MYYRYLLNSSYRIRINTSIEREYNNNSRSSVQDVYDFRILYAWNVDTIIIDRVYRTYVYVGPWINVCTAEQ